MRYAMILGLLLGLAGPAVAQAPVEQGRPNAGFAPAFDGQTRAPAMVSGVALEVEVLSGPLQNPWGIAALPGGGYLVTERPGRLRVMAEDGALSAPLRGLPEVVASRQGGLLDVAVGPEFATDRRIYWTYAKPVGEGMSATAAARGVLSADLTEVTQVEDIFVQVPASASPMHYGSRIVFDGAGHAFVTTGERSGRAERVLAQDPASTYGKVVRVRLDGGVPADNPLAGQAGARGEIWTLGHRNPQGAAMRPGTGELWTIEHGPAGGDELNLSVRGANYGWPVVSYGVNYGGSAVGSGAARAPGVEEPRYYWDPVIAPGGMVFYEGAMFADWTGDLLIGSLNPGGLVRLRLEGTRVVGEERFLEGERRIRDVEVARDGALLLLWDDPRGGVLRVTPRG